MLGLWDYETSVHGTEVSGFTFEGFVFDSVKNVLRDTFREVSIGEPLPGSFSK